MEKPSLKQFLTEENVKIAAGGYNQLSGAANKIDEISNNIEIQCTRRVPHFVKVKDSLSENTTTNETSM